MKKDGIDWWMVLGVIVAIALVIAIALIAFSLVRQVPAWWWAR